MMEKYIAILRGINVSGQKMIKMAELKTLIEELGYNNVITYIQSGNLIFTLKKAEPHKLAKQIEAAIEARYDFQVSVIVKTPAELQHILSSNPFINKHQRDPERLYVTFLDAEPAKELVKKLKAYNYSPEEYILEGKNIYFFSPNGYGNAKMNNNFFENKLKVVATTRNWKTVNKLFELAKGVGTSG